MDEGTRSKFEAYLNGDNQLELVTPNTGFRFSGAEATGFGSKTTGGERDKVAKKRKRPEVSELEYSSDEEGSRGNAGGCMDSDIDEEVDMICRVEG